MSNVKIFVFKKTLNEVSNKKSIRNIVKICSHDIKTCNYHLNLRLDFQ